MLIVRQCFIDWILGHRHQIGLRIHVIPGGVQGFLAVQMSFAASQHFSCPRVAHDY